VRENAIDSAYPLQNDSRASGAFSKIRLAPPKPDLRCADHQKRGVPTVRDLVLAIPAVDHPEPAGFPASSLFKSGGEGISHLVAR
jgi:hypothetical protein